MKKYFIISGLELNDNNRGTAALGYGAFTFLEQNGFISNDDELLIIKGVRNFFKIRESKKEIHIQGKKYLCNTIVVSTIELSLARKFGILLPFSKLAKYLKNTSLVAAINGGDGFSDIYGDFWFHFRLPETLLAMGCKIPVIMLPQTIGPFEKKYNFQLAEKILKYSSYVYTRDNKFSDSLKKLGIAYEKTKDLSAYMKSESWNIDVLPESIGINVSGLCYSNSFSNLEGQFNEYPYLIDTIIKYFQDKGKPIYLIPHSYNYSAPEKSNDDMEACRKAYARLTNKKNVILIDQDLTSPQLKYLISKMNFFIGTRMHANFAAIYSRVPVFGLAYSYKFEGAFNANGLNGQEQTVRINNLSRAEIPTILNKISLFYSSL